MKIYMALGKMRSPSIGDDICLPGVMSNRLAMVFMNEGWDKCMVPSPLSL